MYEGADALPSSSKDQQAEKPQADIGVYDTRNRTTVLIDVRTCAMKVPTSQEQIGVTVKSGEKDRMMTTTTNTCSRKECVLFPLR